MIRSPAGFDGGDRIKRYLDYYQPSYGVMMLSAGQFSPASLFAAGEQGAWYDPSDLSTMFQDAAGTTPVTAVEQPVGKILDKSGRGNHASQSTAASRPVLSARVNLLTYSEQFDNAAWTKQNGAISANAETAPNGTLTADKFTPTAAASVDHRVITGVITTTGGYTLALYVKPAGYSKFGFRNGAVGEHATFNLSGAGAVIEVNSCTATITAEPDGWYKVQIVDTSASIRCDMWPLDDGYTSGSPGSYSYTGDGTSGIYIWGADLRVTNDGVGLPAYQRVAAATDYDTSGFPLYLKFDGVDDSLATGSIDPGAVDKAQVFAGVRKLSDAARAMFAETGSDATGAFRLEAPNAAGNYVFTSRGSAASAAAAVATVYNAPITNVVTGLGDIIADTTIIRINNTQIGSSSADQGTGYFSSYPLYIGRRGGSTLPFNGNLYSLIVRFSAANLSDAQIASTETWVNGKTKAY